MNIKVKEVVGYKGHNISANGSVNLTLCADYSELKNTIMVMQMLNNDVKIKAKLPGSAPIKLGMFRIRDIRIGGDGESTIKFNGLSDYIEMDNLNILVTNERFNVMFEAEIEEENDGEGEEE